MKKDSEYMVEEIQKHLIGATIVSPILDKENDYFGFRVMKDGKEFSVWVDMDPEGNGCGFLNIEI